MEKKDVVSLHNPLSRQKESKREVQAKLKKRKEIAETRRERRRIQQEESRQKNIEEKAKISEERNYFSKDVEKERRSWILGIGNPSPTNEKPHSLPKVDSKRQQYNKAMRKLENYSLKSTCDETSDNSSTPEPRCSRRVPFDNHSDIYHSSQFQVSDLVPSPKTVTNNSVSVICRICQSDEDSLENQLVTPCSCTGSLQYVHHLCLQQWRKTKRASGADVSKCELCLQCYDTNLLGRTDVKPDQTKKMQEDLRRLVRSGVYLMLLVDFCRDTFHDLLEDRNTLTNQSNTVPVHINPPAAVPTTMESRTARRLVGSNTNARTEDTDSSEDNEDYVSRAQVKERNLKFTSR